MPKVLWMSEYSLHDKSSGASINAKNMLESLVQRGVEVWSCSSLVFDNDAGTVAFENFHESMQNSPQDLFELDDNGIHYVYTRCQHTQELLFSLDEGELFYSTFLEVLDTFKPDIVFGYCCGPCTIACFNEARRRGIATVYLLVNGSYKLASFTNFDLVLTESQSTSNYYRDNSHVNVVSTGPFFNTSHFLCADRKPQYVTLVNPVPDKGLPIITKMIEVCEKEMPDVEFVLVNTRGNFINDIKYLHDKNDPNKHPYDGACFKNVFILGTQKNMKSLYSMTKVLVAPSLWYESWGLVASEAVLNGIPVLSSTSGGLPEAMAGGGISIEAPAHCRNDHLSIPTDEEIRPWIDALQRLLNEDWSQQLEQAKRILDVEHATDRALAAFLPFFSEEDQKKFYEESLASAPYEEVDFAAVQGKLITKGN